MNSIMKKIIMTSLLIAIHAFQTNACDVCGCSINTGSSEVIPGVFQNYLGFRTNLRHFDSQHFDLLGEGSILSKEWFHTSELFGRYSPHRRLQFIGFLPFNSVIKTEEGETHHATGFGDARLRVNFLAVDYIDSTKDELLSVFIGGMIKAPTGRYDFINNEQQYFRRSMLPGTGTWDQTISTDVIYRRKNWGTMLSASYIFRGQNEFKYDFGNVFGGQLTGFYRLQGKGRTYLFETGVMTTHLESDYDMRFNEEQIYTEGWMIAPLVKFTSVGEKWSFSALVNHAAWQDLGKGRVQQYFQFDIGLTYFLPTK
jgi:hypothetical protein